MSFLLLAIDNLSADASVGGRPLASALTQWPRCRTCSGNMQFLARIPLTQVDELSKHRDQAVLLFQCQNQPGSCSEWAPDAGGSAALLVSQTDRVALKVPVGETRLPKESGLSFLPYEEPEDPDESADEYAGLYGAPGSKVIGKLGGKPVWVQYDETPNCACGKAMTFVVQLEERGAGGMNFGGGTGFAFVCGSCRESAKFLFQC